MVTAFSVSSSASDAFDSVMSLDVARCVTVVFDALQQTLIVSGPVPPPLAPMVLHLIKFSSGDIEPEMKVACAQDWHKLPPPNWWRRVAIPGGSDADVGHCAPRLRTVRVAAALMPPTGDVAPSPLLCNLAALGTVRELAIDAARIDCSHLEQFTCLRCLDVYFTPLSDAHLPAIASLTSLQTVRINSCNGVTRVGDLSRCVSLTTLELRDVPLALDGLNGLETLPSLCTLVIAAPSAGCGPTLSYTRRASRQATSTGFDLGFLGRAPALRNATLQLRLLRDGLRGLEASRTLERLTLDSTGSLCDISYLSSLMSLTSFRVGSALIGAAHAVSTVSGLPSLTELVVMSDTWSNDAMLRLTPAPSLKHVELGLTGSDDHTNFDDLMNWNPEAAVSVEILALYGAKLFGHDTPTERLQGIELFRNLKTLRLSSERVGDSSFAAVSRLRRLRSLVVMESVMVHAEALCRLTTVTTLELTFCSYLDDIAVGNISRMPSLTDLTLRRNSTIATVRRLLEPPCALRRLCLSLMPSVTDAGFGTPSPTITALSLSGCRQLGEGAIQHLAAAAASLRTLTLQDNGALQNRVEWLRERLPRTKVITITLSYDTP